MTGVVVRETTRGIVVADACEVARGFWRRGVGLLGRDGLPVGGGLLIIPCTSVHCIGMRFTIDVVFLGGVQSAGAGYSAAVLRVATVRPWRLGPFVRGAHAVLELPEGAGKNLRPGDVLAWTTRVRV